MMMIKIQSTIPANIAPDVIKRMDVPSDRDMVVLPSPITRLAQNTKNIRVLLNAKNIGIFSFDSAVIPQYTPVPYTSE